MKEREGPLVTAGQRMFHFGDARQHAGQLATGSFVLQLDSSDQVTALDVEADDHRIIEVGGPDVLTYREVMQQYAEDECHHRDRGNAGQAGQC